MPSFSLKDLTTASKIDHICAAGLLGIQPRLLKLHDSYFELPVDEFLSLWRSSSDQGLTQISNVMKRQFPAYVHEHNSIDELMVMFSAATGFQDAQEALNKAIWYQVNTKDLQFADAVALHKHAKDEQFTKKAVTWVADRLWESYMTVLPADMDSDLRQVLQGRFQFHNARYQGGSAQPASVLASTSAQPVSVPMKNKKTNGSAKRRARNKVANGSQN